MDPTEELQRLRDQAHILEESVRDLDHQIERAMHAVAGGTGDSGHAMAVLTERRNTQLGMMFDLGKLTARIDDLANRQREQTERDLEHQAVQDWESDKPAGHDDHLDWLRPALDRSADNQPNEHEPTRDNDRRDRDGPEDHLDWWQRR